eukprot:380382-Pyramimonas_sp.AAC.1
MQNRSIAHAQRDRPKAIGDGDAAKRGLVAQRTRLGAVGEAFRRGSVTGTIHQKDERNRASWTAPRCSSALTALSTRAICDSISATR